MYAMSFFIVNFLILFDNLQTTNTDRLFIRQKYCSEHRAMNRIINLSILLQYLIMKVISLDFVVRVSEVFCMQ